MSFSPVVHPLALFLFALGSLAIVAFALIRSSRGPARARWILRALLVLACVFTLLRPGIPGGKVEVFAENADIFIVVDTSASMIAEDWGDGEPRLTGVREDVQAIVDRYPGARFSLVTFDSATAVRLPLTTDATALMAGISVLTPEVTDHSRGSSITEAQGVLAQLLQAANASGADRARLVFYFGDGEQTAYSEPGSFAKSKAYVGAGYVFGYGTEEGGPMRRTSADPLAEREYIEHRGERAISVIDEANLRLIADQLEVGYAHRAAGEPIDLPDTPATTTRNSTGEVGAVIDLYWIPAIAAGLLLAVEIALLTASVARVGGVGGAASPRSRTLAKDPGGAA